MSMHTVKQLARLSGVSVRTLHYYDQIGLLKPAQVGANGYRYYGREELLRLQQILLHRELDLPLEAIALLLDDSGQSRVERLRQHRQQLLQRTEHYRELIATVDRTIAELEGGKKMDTKHLYQGFSADKQAEYENWVLNRYASDEQARANLRKDMDRRREHVAQFSKDDLAARIQTLKEVEDALAEHCRGNTPADDPSLHTLLARHREWVSDMWGKPCSPGAYAGLADLYEAHPDFRARYEALAPGFADYLPAVMRAYSRSDAG
jgi:MerR family transcriptional regulator, thiopeptide resistance regulator